MAIPSLSTLLRVVGGVVVVGLVSTAGLLFRYQTSLIYPSSFPAGSKAEVTTPDEYDVAYVEEQIVTPDGEKLRLFVMLQGYQLAAKNAVVRKSTLQQTGEVRTECVDETLARSRPTVLFLHANAGNMGHRLPLAAVFYKRFRCNIVMLSYRGYGFSTGSPNERGIKIDTQSTLDYIRSHPALSSTVVVAYGQSIGGAVAVDLAARNPKSVHALVLENTFLSIPQLIPHVLPPVRPFAFLCREYWNTGEMITRLNPRVPILFLSGRQDELVPPSHMDTLYSRSVAEHKTFKSFPDGTHNDTCVKPTYFDAISAFLLQHVVHQVHEKVSSSSDVSPPLRQPQPPPLPRKDKSSSDEGEEWERVSQSELTDPLAPTLSKAPEL